jgi:hypothetical protein
MQNFMQAGSIPRKTQQRLKKARLLNQAATAMFFTGAGDFSALLSL